MTSLGFDLLDRHVVEGNGDDIACSDDTGTLSYIQLLERTAALAGGLRALGVRPGDDVAVAVGTGNLRVVIACACARIGAVPGRTGETRIVEDGEHIRIHVEDDEFDLSVVRQAGATDPAPSLPSDPPGYADAVRAEFGDVVDALLAGTPIT